MPTQDQTIQLLSKEVCFGFAPKKGPRAMPVTVDFTLTAGLPVYINLSDKVAKDNIEWVQSVYVDNSANAFAFSITDNSTRQTITWPAGAQGYQPFLSPSQPNFSCTTSGGQPVIIIQLLTFPVPSAMWQVGANGSLGRDFSANKPALLAYLVATVAVNALRNSVEVQNQAAGTIQVVLDDGAGANVSILLLGPGTAANTQGADWMSATFKGRIRVFATNTTDQVFVHED